MSNKSMDVYPGFERKRTLAEIKEYILTTYGSLRAFSRLFGIEYMALQKILKGLEFKRGGILQIQKKLNILSEIEDDEVLNLYNRFIFHRLEGQEFHK